jgi:hypothetical protein
MRRLGEVVRQRLQRASIDSLKVDQFRDGIAPTSGTGPAVDRPMQTDRDTWFRRLMT